MSDLENACKRKIPDGLSLPVRPEFEASLGPRCDLIANSLNERFRDFVQRAEEALVSEKRKLEAEFRGKFENYKIHMDAYVQEISEKFRVQQKESEILFAQLSRQIERIPAEAPKVPVEIPLDAVYAADVPTLQAKLRRLWTATEPAKGELLRFLDRLERAIFLGERIDRVYEAEIRRCKDKLPLVQIAAKSEYMRARLDPAVAELELALAQKAREFHLKYGEDWTPNN
jgi:hypothetical protein